MKNKLSVCSAVFCIIMILAIIYVNVFAVSLPYSENFEDNVANDFTVVSGSWSIITDGSRVYRTLATDSLSRSVLGEANWSDYIIETKVKVNSWGSDAFRTAAIMARYSDTNNYYVMGYDYPNGELVIKKKVAGSFTVLDSKTYTFNTGTWYNLKAEVDGTSLKLFVNGKEELSATDGSLSTGKTGLLSAFGDCRFDDYTVSSIDVPPTPTPITGWYSKADWASATHSLGAGNTGVLEVEFDIKPLQNNIDVVVGYADTSTSISDYSHLNMLIRMYTNGRFEVRNGSTYQAMTTVSYSANNTYHVRMVTDLSSQKYDVWVTPPGGQETKIAQDYAFRSGAPSINDLGKVVVKDVDTDDRAILSNHTVTQVTLPTATPSPTPPTGGKYYCDPVNGSMSNPGTLQAPWRRLQDVFAAGKTFKPGDTIYLLSGNHGHPVITRDNADDVVITKYSGHDPIINRITFDGASHWVVDGVKIYTSSQPPEPPVLQHPVYPKLGNTLVQIGNSSSHIAILNCYIYSIENSSGWTANDWNYRAWNGINVYGGSNNVTIENCHLKNLNFPVVFGGDSSHTILRFSTIENMCGDGIRTDGNYATVEYNVVKDVYETNGNHYDLIQAYNPSGLTGIVLRGNILINVTSNRQFMPYGCQGIGYFDGWYNNLIIENNLVVVHHWHGLSVYGARNCKIVNNTVVKNPVGSSGSTPWIGVFNHKNGQAGSGNVLRNNLTSDIEATSGCTSSNNIVSTAYTSHFVNYSGLDFHLKAGSSAINAGTTTDAPNIDLDRKPRTVPYDVGCYEY